jgi:alanyl-tRNA synthetase
MNDRALTPPAKFLTSAQLRAAFLDFFRERGHAVVPSSSLVPGNDPTLLFTNAGMVQFKDVFLGKERRPYVRAASSQRCVRAGGKHNDLENVGYTSRHHTFFEMLGNFSFGDYFKQDAIRYAWDFVTGTLGIPPERLWVTVYEEDDGAADIWLNEIGVDAGRFTRMGAASNFWAMGDTGPCGPCSEIFYDHGPDVPGGPPGSPDEDGDRYVEIWNLVFMQFDRAPDGTLTPLPKPSVDTGMGLERVAAVMQGVQSNYDIDLFRNLIQAAVQATGAPDLDSSSLRVIADHIRATAFLVADGVLPSNEGRGYVLRRIMRRAIRHGFMLGQRLPFFHRLVAPLEQEMGAAYPELAAQRVHIEKVVLQEEERFAETLAQGMALLDAAIAGLGATTREIPGETVFRLYDTYGFPVDLTNDIARERGLTLDEAGFAAAMEAQRNRARAASKFGVDLRAGMTVEGQTSFVGYDAEHGVGRVVALFRGSEPVAELQAGEAGQVVLDVTPFYAESGGQVGDRGELTTPEGAKFVVEDCQKLGKAYLHVGRLESGTLRSGVSVEARVDAELRDATRRNHTATHLLHAALRQVLGTHVTQKGSLVAPDRLRFDFSHYSAVTPEEVARIEALVNAEIRRNAEAETKLMDFDAAVAAGAMALFGEKYEDEVRVLRIGDFSTELCGGTHVRRAGDIGLFKVVSEGGVAAGVRRIEAVTGEGAYEYVVATEQKLRDVAALVRGSREDVDDKVRQVLDRARRLEKEVAQLKDRLASGQGRDLADEARAIGPSGVKLVAASVEGADAAALRNAVDQLKARLGSGVIVLGSASGDDKVTLIAGVTSDLAGRVKAGDVVNHVARQVGGKGGGRADLAQAGGNQPANLPAALASVAGWLEAQVS